MSLKLDITRLSGLPPELDRLVELSSAEGLRFLQRLAGEWRSGANRFAGAGEALFAARLGRDLVGICGLNRDPYCADPTVGRLRHLYVDPAYRRRGVGSRLVGHALGRARGRFRVVRLRTDTVEGRRFYAALGFSPTPLAPDATHQMRLSAA